MSLIFATQLTAVATALLAAFAIVTAWYARRAFLKQLLGERRQLDAAAEPLVLVHHDGDRGAGRADLAGWVRMTADVVPGGRPSGLRCRRPPRAGSGRVRRTRSSARVRCRVRRDRRQHLLCDHDPQTPR